MKKVKNILSAVRRKINYTNNDIGSLLGLNKTFFENARGARIILYHGICMNDPTRFNNIFLPLIIFKEHIRFYKEHFHIISLDDFYNERFRPDRFNVCICFDDGYANNYRYVLPLLEQEKIPAAFFITAIRATGHDILWNDFLGILGKYGPAELVFQDRVYQKKRFKRYVSVKDSVDLKELLRSGGFDIKREMMKTLYSLVPFKQNKQDEEYWQQMTEAEISQLSASPWVTVGSHGYFHNDLSRINQTDAEKEMADGKKYLERLTGKEIRSIAFPYGAYTPTVVESAKKIGFSQLLATDFLSEEDRTDTSMRERFTINPFVSVNCQMIANIKGHYEPRH